MSHEDFVMRWDDTFSTRPAIWKFDPIMIDSLTGIYRLLKLSKTMRKIYQDTCAGKEDEPEFHYPINLRDNIQIVHEFERGNMTFKEAVINVLLPKVS